MNSRTHAERTFALLGNPVSHSLSPVFQNAAIRAAGIPATYVALQCESDEVAGHMQRLSSHGGGGNVTIPHKTVAARAVERATTDLEITGACNTFWMESGRLCGDNTDVAGFRAALTSLAADVTGSRVLLLGAGGAARAVLLGLRQLDVASVSVWNRSPERLAELTQLADRLGLHVAAYRGPDAFDIVINATSLGLHGNDRPPVDAAETGARFAMDLVYRAGGTAWVSAAADAGVTAADGLEMLIQQGARAFERWFGIPAPLAVMRAALDRTTPVSS